MAKKSQKKSESRKNQNNRTIMPLALREKGIYTQKQLYLALLPYMEWVPYKTLREKFEKYIPMKSRNTLNGYTFQLVRDGYIEKKIIGEPGVNSRSGMILPAPIAIRRISRKKPKAMTGQDTGTYGAPHRERLARRRRQGPPKTPKKSVKRLSVDDWKYIRDNPHGVGSQALAKMYNLDCGVISEIRLHNYCPKHIKEQLARSRREGNQAEI